MNCLLISDIHGDILNLKRVLEFYEKYNCEKILIMGDELYHGPRNSIPENYDPKEVAVTLNQYKDKIVACRGNCEAEVDQMLLEYPCMADYELTEVNGRRVMLSHGHLFNEDCLPRLPFEIYISGHTHIPVLEKRDNGIVFVNPGSITFPKNDTPKCFGVMSEEKITIYTLEGEVYKELML